MWLLGMTRVTQPLKLPSACRSNLKGYSVARSRLSRASFASLRVRYPFLELLRVRRALRTPEGGSCLSAHGIFGVLRLSLRERSALTLALRRPSSFERRLGTG